MRKTISLNGSWRLQWFEFGRPEGQFTKDYDDSWWFEARVPGEVHEVLLERGLIQDPFYADNCDKRDWVECVDWWYRKRFFVPEDFKGRKVELIFEGLDTFATVWLNGTRVAESEDMFLPLRLDVTDKLEYGTWNTIAVRLGAPWYETLRRAGDFSEKTLVWNGSYARVYARKAQYHYGWDWAVKLLTVGIWRGVRLETYDKAVLRDVFTWTKQVSNEWAELEVWVEIESLDNFEAELQFEAVCNGSRILYSAPVRLSKGLNDHKFRVKVDKPRLWWPVGYGPQNLYDARVELRIGGEVEDEQKFRFGVRTVELVTESKEAPNGRVFYFKVNGIPVFCKGANWIPADLLISRLSKERYAELLKLAVEGNHNMLRVWGGGLVEYDEFYELCDELGIMLWHDFQFACGHYPEDDEFLGLVEKELEATVRRLRNHPSIMLWCGNNEDEALEMTSGYGVYRHKKDFEVAPRIVKKLDPSRPYRPSSPWGDNGPMDSVTGDAHNWFVWHGMAPIESYLQDESRFMSEFGMQAAPHVNTLRRFLPPDKLWPINDLWTYHYHVPDKLLPYLRDFGEPRWLFSYIFLTQLVQAEALRIAIEHCRRRKFICGGALYWSFNAPWPNACWETVDYYGRPKMGYYAVKRAMAPVIVSPLKRNNEIEVWIVNDELRAVKGTLTVTMIDTTEGKVISEERKEVLAPPNSSVVVAKYTSFALIKEPVKQVLHFKLEYDGGFSRNTLLLAKHRDVNFTQVSLGVEVRDIRREGDDVIIDVEIQANGFARLVYIDVLNDYIAVADDNYFDMLPGEKRKVTLRVKKPGDFLVVVAGAHNAMPVRKEIRIQKANR